MSVPDNVARQMAEALEAAYIDTAGVGGARIPEATREKIRRAMQTYRIWRSTEPDVKFGR